MQAIFAIPCIDFRWLVASGLFLPKTSLKNLLFGTKQLVPN